MVRDGDYVSDERGGFRRAEGSEELLQRVLWKLAIPRGSFPLLPELGSGLHLLGRQKPSQRADTLSSVIRVRTSSSSSAVTAWTNTSRPCFPILPNR